MNPALLIVMIIQHFSIFCCNHPENIILINPNSTKFVLSNFSDWQEYNSPSLNLTEWELTNLKTRFADEQFCEILANAKNFILFPVAVWSVFKRDMLPIIDKIKILNIPVIQLNYYDWSPRMNFFNKWFENQKANNLFAGDEEEQNALLKYGKYRAEVLLITNGKIAYGTYNFILRGGEKYLKNIIKYLYPLYLYLK